MNEHHIIAFDPQGSERIRQFYDTLEKVVGTTRFNSLEGGFFRSVYDKLPLQQKVLLIVKVAFKFLFSLTRSPVGADTKINAGIDEYVFRVVRLRKFADMFGALPLRLINRLYWNLSAEALHCHLEAYSGPVAVIIPDEAYSIPFVIMRNCKPDVTWITNINSYQLNCNLFRYENSTKYQLYGKNSWKPVDVGLERARSEVDHYFQSLFDARMDHHDYSRTYNRDKKMFQPSQSRNKRLLIASHIFCDAPSAHDMTYKDFEAWLTEIWRNNHLLENQVDVYIKEHPSVELYQEEGVLQTFMSRLGVNWKVIPSNLRINIQDFNLVMTCNGSICYECNYLGVPVISGSRGFSENLKNIFVATDQRMLMRFLREFSSLTDQKYERDYTVLFNWVRGRDAFRLQEHNSDPVLLYCERLVMMMTEVRLNSCYTTFITDDLSVTMLTTE